MINLLEWGSLMTAFIGGFGFLLNEMRRLERKVDLQGERIDKQGARTDRLYEMFIDLIKEGRTKE